MAPSLEGSPILAEFLAIMNDAPIMPASLRWLQRLLVRAAVDMTPEPVRSLPQLRGKGLHSGESLLVKVLASTAALIPRKDAPPAQAARRVQAAA